MEPHVQTHVCKEETCLDIESTRFGAVSHTLKRWKPLHLRLCRLVSLIRRITCLKEMNSLHTLCASPWKVSVFVLLILYVGGFQHRSYSHLHFNLHKAFTSLSPLPPISVSTVQIWSSYLWNVLHSNHSITGLIALDCFHNQIIIETPSKLESISISRSEL